MFAHFTFKDGSNPYIATTEKSMFLMLEHYHVQVDSRPDMFTVTGSRKAPATYAEKKDLLREFAIDYQSADVGSSGESWGELASWESFFCNIGRKYGLLREFRENWIC
jgi:hypothetical protein